MELELYKTRCESEELVAEPKAKYEWNNILDRMMINLYNAGDGNATQDALAKAREECREKRIDPSVVDQVERMMRERRTKTNKNTVLLKAKAGPLLSGKSMPDDRTRRMYVFLKIRHPKRTPDELARCVLRYASLGQGGQQWALNRRLMDAIHRQGISVEAFASPFNNYFSRYYSIFAGDAAFGSLGSFFQADMSSVREGLYANPPFTPAALERMAERVCSLPRAVLITPTWRDAPWYRRLSQCGFAPRLKKDEAYTTLGEEFTPRFTTTMWTKGVDSEKLLH